MSRAAAWIALLALAVAPALAAPGGRAGDDPAAGWSGRRIIEESLRRHQRFPYVYEELTMILGDDRGRREVRRVRRFSRIEDDGRARFLLVFDEPEEVRGVALLAWRDAGGGGGGGFYLPALGPVLKRAVGDGRFERFLGTDFSLEDLTGEDPARYRYRRLADRLIEGVGHFVIEARPRAEGGVTAPYALRQLLVRKDNLVVVGTDFYDHRLRLVKRLTRHDLVRVYAQSWRANMLLAEDLRAGHRTLIKVDRRIYSRDYVPAELFEPAFVLANRHVTGRAATGEPVP